MENDILCKISNRKKPKANFSFPKSLKIITAIAASIAIFVSISLFFARENNDDMCELEQLFANLSTEDQSYLIEVYQSDIFINQ